MNELNNQFIVYALSYLILFLICFLAGYRQELVFFFEFRDLKRFLKQLEEEVSDVKRIIKEEIKKIGASWQDVEPHYETLTNFFIVPPVGDEPVGSIERLKQILEAASEQVERKIDLLIPQADSELKANMKQVFLEASRLNRIYKVVKHFYFTGVKSRNLTVLVQALTQLHFLKREAERSFNAVKTYLQGSLPMGCGVGALTAYEMMEGAEDVKVDGEVLIAEKRDHNKQIVIIKPKGPGARTGKNMGEVVVREVRRLGERLIIIVNAQVKMEGEKSGAMSQAIGVAAAPEPLKYQIEKIVARKRLPVISILIKLSEKELAEEMNENLRRAVEKAKDAVKSLLEKCRQPVLIIGLGNTFRIP